MGESAARVLVRGRRRLIRRGRILVRGCRCLVRRRGCRRGRGRA